MSDDTEPTPEDADDETGNLDCGDPDCEYCYDQTKNDDDDTGDAD